MAHPLTISSKSLLIGGTILLQLAGTATKYTSGKTTPAYPQKEMKSQKLNFVVILVDDLGWADIGVNGSTFYQTPNIDELAAGSVQFKNAYAAAPVCSPTRAALLTGLHPARLQLTDWLPGRPDQPSQKLLRAPLRDGLPLEEVTLPEALKEAGYVSANIGKWHLGGAGFGPLEQGFDKNIGGDHTGSPASYFYPYANESSPKWKIPGLEGGSKDEYLTDRLTDEAVQFMQQNQDHPFLLYLAHYAVHIPMKAKDEIVKKYRNLAPGPGTQNNPVYAAMVQSVDESVGRIVGELRRLNLYENTVVIFTSDNGGLSVVEGPNTPATSNTPLKAGKGYLYEGGIRVPLLIHEPERKNRGLVTEVPVSTVDLYPTILQLAGVKANQSVDGKSLVPVLKGKNLPARNIYWHYPHYSNQGGKPGWAIRQGDYKLIEFFDGGKPELYNIPTDSMEEHNLASQLPNKAATLQNQLQGWGEKTGAKMMKPNPDYKTSALNH